MTVPQRVKSGALFARPITPDAPGPQAAARRWTAMRPVSSIALVALMAATCGIFLLQPRRDGAQNLASAQSRHKKPAVRRVQVALGERGGGAEKAAEPTRPSVDFYTKGVRSNLFSAPQPPKPKEAPAPKLPKVIVPPVKPEFVNPFADWTYSGTVTVGDKKMALLENRVTKEGEYVREGQTFLGLAQVKGVTDQMVTLVSAGKPYPLAKSDDINVTPLSSSAAYLTTQPQQPQPGQQPNGAPVMTGMQPQGVPGQGMTLPNGRVLTPEQAARFNDRMNRRFNGGGGRGGPGGGRQGGGRRGGRGAMPDTGQAG